LAEIAQRLGRKALEELATVAKPDTLLAWYRKLIAEKFDGSKFRQRVGRPRIDEEAERLVVQMAKENPGWGYDRIVGALANLGFLLSDQTVGNILRRHGLSPLLRENRPSAGKTLSVHTWKFWWGRIFSLWKSLP
jgi:putative transposase